MAGVHRLKEKSAKANLTHDNIHDNSLEFRYDVIYNEITDEISQ